MKKCTVVVEDYILLCIVQLGYERAGFGVVNFGMFIEI